MKIVIASLLLLMLIGCGGVSIEQEVDQRSIISNEFSVSTRVCVYKWNGFIKTSEYWELVRVKSCQVDSTKEAEFDKAIPVYLKAKAVYDQQ